MGCRLIRVATRLPGCTRRGRCLLCADAYRTGRPPRRHLPDGITGLLSGGISLYWRRSSRPSRSSGTRSPTPSSRSSCSPRDMSRSRSAHSIRGPFPVYPQMNSFRGHWSSGPPRDRLTCAIGGSGGRGPRRLLEAPGRIRIDYRRSARSPGGPGRLPRRGGLCGVGRSTPSHRGAVEYAARAGSESAYAWGDDVQPDGELMANTWQGKFPYRNDGARGWIGTSPVGTFAPNGFGLIDMIGNVWEWTSTRYAPRHRASPQVSGCCPAPAGDPSVHQTLKGGSHLCAPEYCHRYRPAARSSQSQDSATTHIGFRCVAD